MTENEKIKDIIQGFFEKSGLPEVEVRVASETVSQKPDLEFFSVNIATSNASLYIGQAGKNIEAFEQILRLILKKKFGENIAINLDVNNYRRLKQEGLRELAVKAARKARLYKRDVVLEPMSASDRRVVHSELSAHPDIKTESMGEEPRRRIVIKYIP